jgi:putative PEP-CTERM system histidine kinase
MDLASSLVLASAFFAALLAVVVLFHQARAVAHQSFAAGMIVLAAEAFCAAFSLTAVDSEAMVFWGNGSLLAMAFLPGAWMVFSLSYARGNYREFLVRWRPAVITAWVAPVALVAWSRGAWILKSTGLFVEGEWIFFLGWPGLLLNILFLVGAVVVLMNLERTFRSAVGTMRWRFKFLALGLGTLFVLRIYTSSQILLYSSISHSLVVINSGALLMACLLIAWSLLRNRLFNVEVYPSLALLHNSFTVMLVGVYLLVVGVLAKVVSILGGVSAFPLKAFLVLIALVGLAILLLSDRLRQRLRQFVSRHFQRHLYDYRQVWATFTEHTSSLMDETALCRAVVGWISDTFHVLSVTIWLVDARNERIRFGGSTSLPEAKAGDFLGSSAAVATLIQALVKAPFPVDIDASPEDWVATLKRNNPDHFAKGGNRVCVPLVADNQLLGLMTLGDRIKALPFQFQDLDLLKCIADQLAGHLLNVQLSQKLLQAKELEAFQTMSAFFVHDLKNTASTLSLMLQNLETHFEDPAFREDALRAVSKGVGHLNDLISRLSLLREELKMKPAEADINEVVNNSLAGLREIPQVSVVRSLHSVPKAIFDPEQMQKVILNLLLNAKDAVGKAGEIRIETGRRNDWLWVAVSDNGCGMSADFINRSLFRPFQTTKKNGIGIGVFHSKMIVAAHQGKIEVESQMGKGTTFRVLLPLQKTHP